MLRALRWALPCLVALTGPAWGQEWPQFRGPAGDGRADDAQPPVEWSESSHVRWKCAVHGRAWSSPVIGEEQVWMTTATEDGKQLQAVCVDRETGQISLDRVVFSPEKPQFCYDFNSYASSTPVLEGERLYVHYGSHGTACLDRRTGDTLWARTDLPCNHHRGAGSSPIIYRDLLIIPFDGFDVQYVVALDKHTGETVWRKDRDIDYGTNNGDAMKAYGTPSIVRVGEEDQLVSAAAGCTIGYAPLTGEELWRVRSGGMNSAARPLFGLGMIFINTGDGGFRLFALRAEGKGDLTERGVAWTSSEAVPSRCSQLLVDDLLFMNNESGIATCLEANTGKLVWRQRLGGDFCASPVYAGGRIYLFSETGDCPVLAWGREYKLLAKNKLDTGCMASPAVAGNGLYVRTKTHLYRIE